MKLFSLATGLLALAAFVSAQDVEKRLVDISDTELEVKEVHNKPNVDSFVVTVQRTDDLLDDDGTFLAERVMSVAFDFDVLNHEVLLNKVALPLDDLKETPEDPISVTVTVEAGVVVGPALDPETKMDDLMNAFDKGLVTVQVTAATEFITAEDGSIVRRVTLQETIVEVNGQEMTQTDAAQQVIEILADGTMGSYTPIPFGKNGCRQGQGQGMMDIDEAFKSLDDWFHSLNWRGLVCAGVMALFVSLVSVAVLRVVLLKRRQARYARVQQEEFEEFVQVSVVDDKKFVDEKMPLH